MFKHYIFLLITLHFSLCCHATTWHVGPTQTYTSPSQVSTLVGNGDTVLIDAATYTADVAKWTADNLVLKGVGGMAHLKANGTSYGGKAIWVIGGNNTTVDHIEFSLCSVVDQNGAGIRQEGKNLVVTHCYFHNNENGILAGGVNPSSIRIEYSEFDSNGFGDGYTHNLYIGNVDSLIFRYNYSHHAVIGHELKSRAKVNIIEYNRLSNESTGTASRNIDLPDGGLAILIGNIIEQGPNSPNHNLIGYGMESMTNPTPHQMYAINNTLINHYSGGDYFQFGASTNLFKAYNNVMAGGGNFIGSTAPISIDTMTNSISNSISSFGFMNDANYDYNLTASSSLLVNHGTNAGVIGAYSLLAIKEYIHQDSMRTRCVNSGIDIGAYEFCLPTNIHDEQLNMIQIYPNPATNWLRVSNIESIDRIKILNMMGEEIMNVTGIKFIDVSDLKPGVYFIELKDFNEIKVMKFIKE